MPDEVLPQTPGSEGMAEATAQFAGLLSGKPVEKVETEKAPRNRGQAARPEPEPVPVEEPEKAAPGPDDTESDGADAKAEESHPAPQIAAPRSMTSEDRERFEKLPPEIQQWVVDREKHVERGGEKVTRKATEAEKTYKAKEAEIATQLQQLAEKSSLYRHPDIAAFERDYGPNGKYTPETDPLGYLLARDKAAKAAQDEQAMHAQHAQKQQEAMNEFRQNENQRLREIVPALKDEKAWQEFDRDVTKYVLEVATGDGGFDQDKAARALITAPAWALKLVHKAMLYDKATAKMKEQTTTAKPSMPALKSGTREIRNGAGEAIAADMKRLQKSGRVEDAARIFGRMLG